MLNRALSSIPLLLHSRPSSERQYTDLQNRVDSSPCTHDASSQAGISGGPVGPECKM